MKEWGPTDERFPLRGIAVMSAVVAHLHLSLGCEAGCFVVLLGGRIISGEQKQKPRTACAFPSLEACTYHALYGPVCPAKTMHAYLQVEPSVHLTTASSQRDRIEYTCGWMRNNVQTNYRIYVRHKLLDSFQNTFLLKEHVSASGVSPRLESDLFQRGKGALGMAKVTTCCCIRLSFRLFALFHRGHCCAHASTRSQ